LVGLVGLVGLVYAFPPHTGRTLRQIFKFDKKKQYCRIGQAWIHLFPAFGFRLSAFGFVLLTVPVDDVLMFSM